MPENVLGTRFWVLGWMRQLKLYSCQWCCRKGGDNKHINRMYQILIRAMKKQKDVMERGCNGGGRLGGHEPLLLWEIVDWCPQLLDPDCIAMLMLRSPLARAVPSQWLSLVGLLRPAHCHGMQDSSRGDSGLSTWHQPCQNIIRTVPQLEMILSQPSFLSLYRGQT